MGFKSPWHQLSVQISVKRAAGQKLRKMCRQISNFLANTASSGPTGGMGKRGIII